MQQHEPLFDRNGRRIPQPGMKAVYVSPNNKYYLGRRGFTGFLKGILTYKPANASGAGALGEGLFDSVALPITLVFSVVTALLWWSFISVGWGVMTGPSVRTFSTFSLIEAFTVVMGITWLGVCVISTLITNQLIQRLIYARWRWLLCPTPQTKHRAKKRRAKK